MNKQSGSTLSTTINQSRSCYIKTNRFAFFSVETIFARTIDIFNNTLNCFDTLFKNVNPCTKRQEKGICLIFKRSIAYLTNRPTLRTLIIVSAVRLKSLFVKAKFNQTLCFWAIHVPNDNNGTIVVRKISATHRNCSEKYHTCKQQKIDSCRDVRFRGNPG